ncbi:peptidoglycan/LPS O-acetylase OafA/YrhL [Clostridium tetanomorphum]|uniref:Acyltransferase n=1 Tax=Clostridium tetanomorphum TaxID=1553 RepID=A0A923J0W0_CLOTT|nr:acyltransferase [Clostridium tetanomorphum]MBC2398139.1 acyltransferase [Clostridium tetanomorphum]MBP1866494.1 peptidoglycan/LPS O-acetylase OafA/YrhL [Clostridium tetanomorphum]NRS84179.1 peptidoglycan/LPS O-acetylase OafA/YrhL [Clostridium tetanomorphum]NRZ97391.1 peptidoglycan/LPS O-acetylase OafA/YrhL [Clostridium tetanomorphum]
MTKQRLKELDIIRAIAFIFVVAQHILGGYSYIKGLPKYEYVILKIFYIVVKPAVPIFLAISAVSLFYVYYNNFNMKKYYIKRIKYILIPYIIWSAINMYKLGNSDRFNGFIWEVLAGNGGYHLWYMGMILRLYIYFPIILYIVKRIHNSANNLRIIVFISIFPVYYMLSKYQYTISQNLGKFIFNNPTELQQKFINVSALFWILYFILGIYIGLNYETFKSTIMKFKWLVIMTYLPLLTYAYMNEIEGIKFIRSIYILFNIFTILIIYVVAIYLSNFKKVYSKFKFIGDYSFAGYMAHIIVLNWLANNLQAFFGIRNHLILGMLVWILTSIVTPLIISFLSCFPYSQYVTGAKNNILKNIEKRSLVTVHNETFTWQ